MLFVIAVYHKLKQTIMRKLSVFNFATLNGYFKGSNGDISWHNHQGEEKEYAEEGAQSDSILLFGRVTYEMMAGYWPSENAKETNPVVADGMNKADKIVFSTTLKKADWNNTKVMSTNIIDGIKELKKQPGKDMTILGSGTVVTQFAEHGLIDEYQIMLNPIAIGDGTSLFKDIKHPLKLKLTQSKVFKSGIVLLCYAPA